jgi:CxxC motif-containing protein (DUF1111 family)
VIGLLWQDVLPWHDLTHPKELSGGQSAVANKAGTLIFAKPSVNLTNDEWKDFFESLRILR